MRTCEGKRTPRRRTFWRVTAGAATVLLVVVTLGACGGGGSGSTLVSPEGVAVAADDTVLVTDDGLAALAAINPETGAASFVSTGNIGSGPDLQDPIGLKLDSSGAAIVVDSTLPAILRIDTATGDRTIVSGLGTGSGPALIDPIGLAIESGGTFIVVDAGLPGLIRVDPATGTRTIVSDNTRGTGPAAFVDPVDVAVDASGDLFVTDQDAAAVFRVNAGTGNRTVLSGASRGSGVELMMPTGIVIDRDGAVYVSDPGHGEIIWIDPQNGNRTLATDSGTPPTFLRPAGLALDNHTGIVIADSDARRVYVFEPESGSVRPIGGGPPTDGGEEGFGNNAAVPIDFAEGIGLGGLPVLNPDTTPNFLNTGLRPTAAEAVAVTALPFASLVGSTTCVDADGDGMIDVCAYPQQTESAWQPEWVDGSGAPVPATVDWGDNLVRQTWTARSTVRVEVVLTDLIDQTTGEPANAPDMTGFNMFYLSGEKAFELQGTDGMTSLQNEVVFSICPRLQIDKLSGTDPNGPHGTPVTPEPLFDGAVYENFGAEGGGPGRFGAEVNVAGRTIYGFIWRLREFAVPEGVSKTGWWRLTFRVDPVADYTITDEEGGTSQSFSVPSNVVLNNIHPLDTTAFVPPVRQETESILYEPQLDAMNNLSFIDIFITESRESGGMGGGGGGM